MMIPYEAVDCLKDRQQLAYIWLVRHSTRDGEKLTISLSCRELAEQWRCSLGTVNRTLHSLEGFIVIHKSFSRRECLVIEIVNNPTVGTQNGTQSGTQSGTQKTTRKSLKTKGVQELKTDMFGTQSGTQVGTQNGTLRAYKNDNIIISCLNILIKNNKEKECIYFVNALERIGENANSMSDKSDAEAERLLPIFVKEYYNLMVETNKASMGKIKTAIINQRLQFLKARIKESGLINVLEVINKSTQSRFLNGGGNRGFVANFEWIMRPNNFPKVLEGTYDNRIINNNGYADRTNSTRTAAEQRAFDVAARIAELAAEDDANERLWQQR